LTKHKAEILSAKRWDERKLAYEIKKQKRATYFLVYFKAPPGNIDALNREFTLTEPVLRSLVLQVESVPAEAYEPERDFSERGPETEGDSAGGTDGVGDPADDIEVPALSVIDDEVNEDE
jgi:small subunit ribosomal protein S6